MESVFRIVAVILIGIAAYFFWRNDSDAAFVSFVLGACAFFLSIRFRIKGRLRERDEEMRGKGEEEQSETTDD